MTETKDSNDKTIRGGERKPLSLQRTVESGHVRQNFSHGRSKSVVVERRTKRKLAQPGGAAEAENKPTSPAARAPQKPKPDAVSGAASQPKRAPASTGGQKRGQVLETLSDGERDARARALAAARQQDQVDAAERAKQEKAAAVEAAKQKAADEEAAKAAPAKAEAAKPKDAEAASAKAGEKPAEPAEPTKTAAAAKTAKPKATAPSADKPAAGATAKPSARPPAARSPAKPDTPAAPQRRSLDTARLPRSGGRPKEIVLPGKVKSIAEAAIPPNPDDAPAVVRRTRPAPAAKVNEDEDTRGGKGDKRGKTTRPTARVGDERRERGKLTIDKLLGDEQRQRSLASLKRKREREKQKAMGISQPREKISREVTIPEVITIQELANRMTERAVDVIKYLMKQGDMRQMNDVIDVDTAELIVEEFGHTPKRVSEADVEEGFIGEVDEEGSLKPRAPVVTIMGHVDHGKTSLLDAIREANVVSGEAGGITQHIGAYQVRTPGGEKVTFIDTPGHAAFTSMRARGAKVTDIVILVVAADDGVMPQTIEAINHAKAAEVPIIVAINKIDKPSADPSRVRTELLQHEVVVESMSGETLEIEVSALKRMNLDKLLEAIQLQSELLDLTANPERSAEGVVIEAKLERGRGPVGTVLVQRGTLAVGDIVVAGSSWGRVRALINDQGKNTAKAGPSVPVEILGFDAAPEAGDQFAVVENEARARELTEYRDRKRRDQLGAASQGRTLEQMMQSLKDEAGKSEFPLVIKGDVMGSVEAINGALKKLGTDEVEARLVHTGVGGITESDVTLADASKAIIVGFNVRANTQAKFAAEQAGIEIRYYNIIYDLVDDVKSAMSGLLAPTIRENFIGNAEVLQVFNITKVGKVAGCRVTEGKVERGAKVRLIRDNVVIHEGSLSVLKRFKDDVKEVPAGQECGMSFTNYHDLREGDVIECFQVETIARSLDD
ncbi:MAG: translation initiation factor IF-2 [Pseudomonadota bacterium]